MKPSDKCLQLFFDEFPGFAFSKTRDSEFDLDSQHFLYRHTTITKSSNGNEQWRWTGLLSIKRFRRTHSGGMVILTVEPSNGNSKRLYIHVPVSELLDAIERDTHKRKKPTATFSVSANPTRSQKNRALTKLIHDSVVTDSELRKTLARR